MLAVGPTLGNFGSDLTYQSLSAPLLVGEATTVAPGDVGLANSTLTAHLANGGGSDRLTIKVTGTDLPAEREPNGALGTANDASANFVAASANRYQLLLKGDHSTPSDSDYFKLGTLEAGDILTLSQLGSPSARGTLSDPYVYLYRGPAAAPILVASNDDSGSGRDSLIYRLSIPATDTYYVVGRGYGSWTGTYQLGVYLENSGVAPLTGGGLANEAEPNDGAIAANDASTSWRTVQYQSQTTAGFTANDTDFYKYRFTAGDLVTIEIDSTSRGEGVLLNAAGTVLTSSYLPSADSIIYAFEIPTTGEYYLRTQAYGAIGAYTAKVYLSTITEPPRPTGLQIAGSTLKYNSVAIGSLAGGVAASPLVVTFNESADEAVVQAVADAVSYHNISATPALFDRNVRMNVTDSTGLSSAFVGKQIHVIISPPALANLGADLTYVAGSGATIVAPGVTVTPGSNGLTGAQLWAQLPAAGGADRLSIVNSGMLVVSGSTLIHDGLVVGSFTGGTASTTLVVTFNALATKQAAQAVARAIAYRNVSATPALFNRTFTMKLIDNASLTSDTLSKVIRVE